MLASFSQLLRVVNKLRTSILLRKSQRRPVVNGENRGAQTCLCPATDRADFRATIITARKSFSNLTPENVLLTGFFLGSIWVPS
jgi:hypothetical protein